MANQQIYHMLFVLIPSFQSILELSFRKTVNCYLIVDQAKKCKDSLDDNFMCV